MIGRAEQVQSAVRTRPLPARAARLCSRAVFRPQSRVRAVLAALAAGVAVLAARPGTAEAGESGRPLPRFASLKTDRASLLSGPGTDFPAVWVLRRAGWPVEIVEESGDWRHVRDAEGAAGWVRASLLSARRTALVRPGNGKPEAPPRTPLRVSDSSGSRTVAEVEAGVIADLHRCDGRWCRVTAGGFAGYIEQKNLWGLAPGETVE